MVSWPLRGRSSTSSSFSIWGRSWMRLWMRCCTLCSSKYVWMHLSGQNFGPSQYADGLCLSWHWSFLEIQKKHVFCVSSKILVIFYCINLLNTHSGFFMFICMRRSLQWYSNNTERNPRLFNMPLKNIVQHVCSTFFNKKMIYHLRWLFVLVSVENENLRTRNGHESP